MKQKKLYVIESGDFCITMTAYEAPGLIIQVWKQSFVPGTIPPVLNEPELITLCDLDGDGVEAMAKVIPWGKKKYTWWEKVVRWVRAEYDNPFQTKLPF